MCSTIFLFGNKNLCKSMRANYTQNPFIPTQIFEHSVCIWKVNGQLGKNSQSQKKHIFLHKPTILKEIKLADAYWLYPFPFLHVYPLREPDPSSVQFTFIKTEGSQEHGILMTHHNAFKWHNQHVSKDGVTWLFGNTSICLFQKSWFCSRYNCALKKKTGCTGSS